MTTKWNPIETDLPVYAVRNSEIADFIADLVADYSGQPAREPVALPDNITRIETQSELYTYGVASLGYQEVADEAEAVERAEGRRAFLLKSKVLPVWYLIFPHVIVEPMQREYL